MTLRMADSTTVALLPSTFDAYAGYVDGAWRTFPMLEQRFGGTAGKALLSISVMGNRAFCADVENGAMSSWRGYLVGYCSVSRAASLVTSTGRPTKLWTAHYTGAPHICGPSSCGLIPFDADGTQWTDTYAGRSVDQSLLADDFFTFDPQPQPQQEAPDMVGYDPISGGSWGVKADGSVYAFDGAPYLGGLNNHPEWNTAQVGTVAGIAAWKGDGTPTGGNGYVIYVETATAFDLYRFPGDGSLKG